MLVMINSFRSASHSLMFKNLFFVTRIEWSVELSVSILAGGKDRKWWISKLYPNECWSQRANVCIWIENQSIVPFLSLIVQCYCNYEHKISPQKMPKKLPQWSVFAYNNAGLIKTSFYTYIVLMQSNKCKGGWIAIKTRAHLESYK